VTGCIGVATAEAHFVGSSAVRTPFTGALGQALAMREPLIFSEQSDDFYASEFSFAASPGIIR